jgi:hypothetical protein
MHKAFALSHLQPTMQNASLGQQPRMHRREETSILHLVYRWPVGDEYMPLQCHQAFKMHMHADLNARLGSTLWSALV